MLKPVGLGLCAAFLTRTTIRRVATAAASRTMATQAHASGRIQGAAAWHRRMAALGLGATIGVAAVAASSDAGATAASPIRSAACAGGRTADWPPPILSSATVYTKLASPVETIHPVQRGVIREYHVNQYAANPNIEDTVAIVPAVSCPPGGFLAGVFDGHSGKDASKWCSEELLSYLQYYRWSNRTDQLVHKRTFVEADHHFLELALREKRMAAGLSGACVNVAHVCGTTVRTANAGDCRTIVGKRVKTTQTPGAADEFKFQAVELTSDHQIDTNSNERERLLRDHPDEADIILKNRVKGRLQPTRGFGDGFYKVSGAIDNPLLPTVPNHP